MKNSIIALFFTTVTFACSNNKQHVAAENNPAEAETSTDSKTNFKPEMVVNTIDFACGMPVSAGISDTCHYEDKAYGFCSAECKAEFLKEPSKYLAAKK